jgi:hypothetical protein
METEAKKSTAETLASWVQYLGMTIAMLGGATWPAPRWTVVAGGIGVLGAGIVWARLAAGKRTAAGVNAGGDRAIERVQSALDAAKQRTAAVRASAESAAFEAIANECEGIVRDCVEAVAAQQESLSRTYGFAGYAQVMTPFAAAERWLNRTWSAASDAHRPEVLASLDHAIEHIDEALRECAVLTKSAK